ncbi:MAG: Coenzyme F420 hydrogenase/dehydrogenase, beta subunit C-terminal domain [Ruminococcus flavefaciens]|nr:Coenzyme F420 hydrogenase/dehydrogenase, beta subunit C-terminal domain [Ruminococcus flavefaciens]
MTGYLYEKNEATCFGCEACVQICPQKAISMPEDREGFRYPAIDQNLCVECGLCHKVCPYETMPARYGKDKYAFGGYVLDDGVRFESTSGGAFSAIVDVFCDENYVIFGAEAAGLRVFHSYITDKTQLFKFRKSKYSQSIIGDSYQQAKIFLNHGRKVLFSGTPCQIAGLRGYLGDTGQDRLLTVEVICEGVPSPLYIRKFQHHIGQKSGAVIRSIDYRYKGYTTFRNIIPVKSGRWDFERMRIVWTSPNRQKTGIIETDRWFNPFWSIWLKHLMSRPSCYECPFATQERIADCTLGDLWGVHIYCPELYGKNGGASLIVANTAKGKGVVLKAREAMYGHELKFEDALKYQSPMRKHIDKNPQRNQFMSDLQSDMSYHKINRKWAAKPSLKLLWQKYIWGNRQKVWLWNLLNPNK